ncbi:MAG: hypothetical protein V1927_03300 [Candidatus Omnitrophota bacterium]
MVIALWTIGALILVCVVILQKFMRDMAVVEKDLLKEIKEVKAWLIKINEKQL